MPTSARCWDFGRPSVGADDLGVPFPSSFVRRPEPPSIVKKDGFPRRPVGPPRNDKGLGLSLRGAKRRGNPRPRPQRLPCAKGAGTAKGRLRDCPALLDTLGMISAPIPTHPSRPRRRRSAVRRWPGQSRRLSATTRRARRPSVPSPVPRPPQGVGADAHDWRPKFRFGIWLAEAMP